MAIRLPLASGGPSAVAYSTTADGNLFNLNYERANAGEFVAITFVVPERFFQIEFYEPIATALSARSYRYAWPGDLAADRVTVVVQEPAEASAISVEPSLEIFTTGQGGAALPRDRTGRDRSRQAAANRRALHQARRASLGRTDETKGGRSAGRGCGPRRFRHVVSRWSARAACRRMACARGCAALFLVGLAAPEPGAARGRCRTAPAPSAASRRRAAIASAAAAARSSST